MSFRTASIVWKKQSDHVRRPFLRLEPVWPAALSPATPACSRTVELIESLVEPYERGWHVLSAPGAAVGDESHRLNGVLARLCRYFEIATRETLIGLFREFPAVVSAQAIEYPYIDRQETLKVFHFAHRFITEINGERSAVAEREAALVRLAQIKEQIKPGYPYEPAIALIQQARAKKIPCMRISQVLQLFMFGHGSRQKRLWNGSSGATSYFGVVFATNKSVANDILALNGLPVPAQRTVVSAEMARQAAAEIGFPVVVKPQNTDFGTAVETGIVNNDDLQRAFETAHRYGNVLVEKHIDGFDHRILVVDGKATRVYKRTPAHVTGDGVHTVGELIEIARQERFKIYDLRQYGFVKPDDPQVVALLAKQKVALGDIPASGRVVLLRTNGNVSTGGTGELVTETAHPDNLRVAERAAALLGLDIAGVDFICPDIAVSWLEGGTGICEVNPNPGMPIPDDADRLFDYFTAHGSTDLRVPIVVFAGARQEIEEARTALVALAGSMDLTLTTVHSRAVYQNGRQISARCPTFAKAIEIGLCDRLTDALLVCFSADEPVDLSANIDFGDLAFISSAFPVSEPVAQLLSSFCLKVVRGDPGHIGDQCRELFGARH